MTALSLLASSARVKPQALRAGHHLVLGAPPVHGLDLPTGVLLDDHLSPTDRAAVDARAHAAIAQWRELCDPHLQVADISVADIWHAELFAEVFLPVAKAERGVPMALLASGAAALRCAGVDAELAAGLSALLAEQPVRIETGPHPPPPAYPSELAMPPSLRARAPVWQTFIRELLRRVAMPSVGRPGVLVVPYGPTAAVLERMAVDPSAPPPAITLEFPPKVALALRALRRGGWLARPGGRALALSARELAGRLDACRALRAPRSLGPLGDVYHQRALRCLWARAQDTMAAVRRFDRDMRAGRVLAALLPSDHEPLAKTLILLCARHGVPTVSLQHGYETFSSFRPGTLASGAGLWSSYALEAFGPDHPGHVRVVGNPGLGSNERAVVSRRRRRGARLRVVVLVEHVSRYSARLDPRITAMHLAEAMEGIRRSSLEWDVVVRPHPADPADEIERLVERCPGSEASVDASTPLRALLRTADVCVGAISTGALETSLEGVSLIMLDVTGMDLVPPLDGSGSVPCVVDAAGLADHLNAIASDDDVPGARELFEALGGGVDDPVGQVLALLAELRAPSAMPGERSSGRPAAVRRR